MRTLSFQIKAISVIAILSVVLFTSCDELYDEFGLSVKTDYVEMEFSIYPSEAGDYVFTQEIIADDIDSILTANGSSRDKLQSITVVDGFIETTSYSVEPDFSKFSSMWVVLRTGAVADTIAWNFEIPENSSIVDFNLTNNDISEYIDNEMYNLDVWAVLDEEMTDTLIFKAMIRYELNLGF
jgi:hypothetical protein